MTFRNSVAMALMLSLLYGAVPLQAQDRDQRRIAWSELSQVIGKKVKFVMPDGALIEGRPTEVQSDALAVNITKTSDKATYPKGHFLVPRATLRTFEVSQPKKRGKVIGLVAGGGVGVVLAVLAWQFHSGFLSSKPLEAGLISSAVGLPIAGYFMGGLADRLTITYVVAE